MTKKEEEELGMCGWSQGIINPVRVLFWLSVIFIVVYVGLQLAYPCCAANFGHFLTLCKDERVIFQLW